ELLVLPRGEQGRLVHEIGEVGAGEARRAARQHLELHVGRERNAPRVHAQDLLATLDVGARDDHLTIEAPRTQKRRVERVGAVGGRDEDDALVRLEAVHLHQELVQRLLALIVAAAETGAAVSADRIDLVHEDDARRVLLALLEQIAHARGPDTDEHLDEIGSGNREERNVRLAGDRLGEQRLAGAGRTDEQHALGNLAAELLELLRILEEVDDLAQLFLRLVDTGHV